MIIKTNQIIQILQNGGVILIATDTVYGLAALPDNEKAVAKIYELKQRPREMFLPVMVASMEDLEKLGVDINDSVSKLFASDLTPGAITFVLGFSDGAAKPDWLKMRDEIAVRIPDNDLLLSVLRETGALLVTSANLHGHAQTPGRVKDILAELNGTPDLIVEDGEGKEMPSTIVNCRYNPPKIERCGLISEEIIHRVIGCMAHGKPNIILGIETSCDDTAAAIVDSEGHILSSVVASQLDIHSQFGGIYPEFAARAHIAAILPAVNEAFKIAGIAPQDITAIGVTRGPGLIGSLLVGLNAAAGLGLGWNKPVIGVNHLRGHLRSADLEQQRIKFPATVLLVSGGHTLLAYMKSAAEIELLGATADDSVGECYDKVGRMLGLGYPGGPAVDKLARQGKATIPFPRPVINKGLAFSFSGLKSAVLRYMEANPDAPHEDIAASFVQAVMDVLIKKSRLALMQYPSLSFAIVGGVAASSQLREEAAKLCKKMRVELCLPPLRWSTDNAAMIALATFDYLNLSIHKEPVAELQLTMECF